MRLHVLPLCGSERRAVPASVPSLLVCVALCLLSPLPFSTPSATAQSAGLVVLQGRYSKHNWTQKVQLDWNPNPSVFKTVTRDEDQLNIYAENLEPDLAIWRHRAPLKTAQLMAFLQSLHRRSSRRAIAIRGGDVHVLTLPPLGAPASSPVLASPTCAEPCDSNLIQLVADLRAWAKLIPFPDVVFFLNTGDVNICKGPRAPPGPVKYKQCYAPVFSFHKEWDQRRDEDLLVPVTTDAAHPLFNLDWRHKIDRAFFRGTFYCHSRTYPYAKDVCSRTYLARMSLLPEPAALIDVGFIDNYTAPARTAAAERAGGQGGSKLPEFVPAGGFVPLSELARFKYLLHLDGITASNRLIKVMHTNSVVFKQKSPWIEWYYRSLVEGTHYFSFWETHRNDIFQIIKYVRHKARYLQEVAQQGQMFAHAYGSPTARMLYWRRALTGYKALFPDMDEHLATLLPP